MMKKIYIMISFMAIYFCGFSQFITPEVVASTGEHYQNGAAQVSFTIGEIATETFNDGNHILTQGFQQPQIVILAVEDFEKNWNILIFPNPSTDAVQIHFDNQVIPLEFALYNVQGQLIRQVSAAENFSMDVSGLSAGNYFLNILRQDGKKLKTIQLQKN